MAEKTFNQEFEGYWRAVNVGGLPKVSGIYTVQSCIHNKKEGTVSLKKLIYIGEAEDIQNRILNHERWKEWEKHLKINEELCFNITRIESAYRERVEAALINSNQPPLNNEYKYSFPFDETHVNSSERYSLLKQRITVKYHI